MVKKLIHSNSVFIVVIVLLFCSCTNSSKEINDFLADQNLPIGVAESINHMYKDSGRITSRLIAPKLLDFTNRKLNPYSEFPEGIKIVTINKDTRDSVTVTGKYAISFSTTSFSEIIGNVVIVNHTNKVTLHADQMYWDQREGYFFTKTPFTLFTEKDTVHGVGFESDHHLENWILNNTNGNFIIDSNNE